MINIVVQPEVIKELADCVVDVITNKIDWSAIDWQAVAEKAYQRPQGEWIVDEDNIFENFRKCSNCNEGAEWLDGGSQFLSNYCPNCGAKMQKGGAEE